MGNYLNGDEILARCTQLGVSGVELRMQPVELFLGSPTAATAAAAAERQRAQAAAGRGRGRGRAGGGRAALTPEQQAAQKAAAEATRKWRQSAPMGTVKAFRKKFEDAGVAIEVVKVDGIFGFADDEVDYAFALAKQLGATALSTEISRDIAQTTRVGRFADKHKMMIGYHGHTETGPAQWEETFAHAKHNGANLDIGHFVGGHKTSPIPFLKQHHDRITHIHVKDKTLEDANVPFGTGNTPIKEALQLIRDNKWKMQATIEFEYPIPQGSDRMTELAKCVQYCKDALLA